MAVRSFGTMAASLTVLAACISPNSEPLNETSVLCDSVGALLVLAPHRAPNRVGEHDRASTCLATSVQLIEPFRVQLSEASASVACSFCSRLVWRESVVCPLSISRGGRCCRC